MIGPGATHRGAPFVGRERDLALLDRLLRDGLHGIHPGVWVAGAPGSGRRRLIAEALRRGPDAEWVHLAPGGAGLHLDLWIRSELPDLVETHPQAPYPSWAIHALTGFAPRLRGYARVPALSRERGLARTLRDDPDAASRLAAAVAAVLNAVASETALVVDLGLWPAPRDPARTAIARTLSRLLTGPGVVVVGAVDAAVLDPVLAPVTRVLQLDPLTPGHVVALCREWVGAGGDAARLAAWLHRVTGGYPLFAHEAVRWLEEHGCLHVDDEIGRVRLLQAPDRFPLPLGLETVMVQRFRRLPPASQYLLHLLTQRDGGRETDVLRRRYRGPEGTFEEALAFLRRRAFLLRRAVRHPPATTSPLWKTVAQAPSRRRLPRRDATPGHRAFRVRRPAVTPLAAMAARLRPERSKLPRAGAVAIDWRALRGREGPAWDGLRGRLAVAAARRRHREEKPAKVLLWMRWGFRRLPPDRHPGLRRALGRLGAGALESLHRSREADRLRAQLLDEAILAGHLWAAEEIRAALAEGKRRLGDLPAALREATRAEEALRTMGETRLADLSRSTRVRALVDQRRLGDAARLCEAGSPFPTVELQSRLLSESDSVAEFADRCLLRPFGDGWGFGLETHGAIADTGAFILSAGSRAGGFKLNASRLEPAAALLRDAGLLTPLADLLELVLLEDHRPEAAPRLEELAAVHARLDAPERTRGFGARLFSSPWRRHPACLRTYGHALLRMEPATSTPVPPRLRLHLLGRPRVLAGEGIWPRALWPEWWARLLAAAVAAAWTGRRLEADAVRAVLVAAGEPPADWRALVARAQELLWGPLPPAGGFVIRGHGVAWSWDGLWCDVKEIADGLEAADALDAAGAAGEAMARRDAALELAEGPLLPGQESDPGVRALRGDLESRIRTGVVRRLGTGEVAGESYRGWLEGAGTVVDLGSLMAPALRARGWGRAALALRRDRS